MIGAFIQLNEDSKRAESHPLGYVIDGTGCWEWVGGYDGRGYPSWTRDGVTYRVHRMLYEEEHGRIPRGMHLHHRCENPRCVNPAHCEPVRPQVHPFLGPTFAASNAAKRHCPRGHAYDPTNYYGGRRCRECGRARWGVYNQAHPARERGRRR